MDTLGRPGLMTSQDGDAKDLGYQLLEGIARVVGAHVVPTRLLLSGGGPPLRSQIVFNRGGLHLTVAANEEVVNIEIRSGSSVVMSIGAPDELLVFADTKVARVGTVDVYARQDGFLSPTEWLNETDHLRRVESLALQRSESILIANRISAILKRPLSLDVALKRIDALIALCISLPRPAPSRYVTAPGSLYARLEPWIREWGVPDDVERSELINGALTENLLTFWETVGPLIEEVQNFLESTRDDDDEALQMLWLAVAAAEIRLELQMRGIEVP